MAYNNNNNKRSNNPTAFMVAHEDKNGGTYYKGTADLGGGKSVKLVMFPVNAPKAEFAVEVIKKTYKKRNYKTSW